ncbi:MAG: hypothetical protein ACUVQX_06005 [Candidatus Bathycorpusculaceae bacterium]
MAFKFSEVFHETIVDVLEDILGERGMKAILFHVELGDYLEDPAKLHRDLCTMFGVGAKHIEKVMVKELFRRLNLPFEEKENFDFGKTVEQARELFMARMKEIHLSGIVF